MKKIMFNDRYGLTEAVLQGRKTMTRRLCKEFLRNNIILADEVESVSFYSDENLVEFVLKDGGVKVSVPPYKVGDVAAVAQSYKSIHEEMMNGDYGSSMYDAFRCARVAGTKGWNNKMFVCADLIPHRIRFTDLKLEKLQNISDDDCMREGVLQSDKYAMPYGITDVKAPNGVFFYYSSPREAFGALIDKVSGKGTWESNPYVYAYSFELVQEGGQQ